MSAEINSIIKSIQPRIEGFSPEIGIILGTGLSPLANEIRAVAAIPYSDIPGFPVSTVKGHEGQLIFGTINGRRVMAMQGRFHYYEGYSMKQIALPVRIMRALGVHTLIVSNASGGMNPAYKVGDVVLISDHINLFPDNPLIGPNDDAAGPRFPDMSEAYSRRLIKAAGAIATAMNIPYHEGVYAGLTGPCFETPAEYRYLRRIGADIVGMSTVPEVIVAKHSGMEVFGLSIVTDLGIEGHVDKVSHEMVLQEAARREPQISALVSELVKQI